MGKNKLGKRYLAGVDSTFHNKPLVTGTETGTVEIAWEESTVNKGNAVAVDEVFCGRTSWWEKLWRPSGEPIM